MVGQLTGLHAKFTGDASSFAGAARLSAFEMNKLNAKLSENKRKNEEAANSSEGVARSLHKLRMETDSAYAGMARFEKASILVKQISDSQKWSHEQLGAELQRLATHYGVAEAAGMSTGNSMKSARFHAANLGAQFNDIGVMLASGQSPFMLAIQQGTQISQVLQAAGGSAKETGKLLLASFRSIISPISLVTIGVIAAGAALFYWATKTTEAEDAVKSLKEATDAYSKSLDKVEGDINSVSSTNDAYVKAFKSGSKEIMAALAAEAKARQAIMALDLIDAQAASKSASEKAKAQQEVVAGLAEELAMKKQLVNKTAARAAGVPASVPGTKGAPIASPEALAARMALAEYQKQSKELEAQKGILARNTAEYDAMDAKLALINAKMAASKDILDAIAGGLPPIVDDFNSASDSSTKFNDALAESLKKLRDARTLASSGASSQEDLDAQTALNSLVLQRVELEDTLAKLQTNAAAASTDQAKTALEAQQAQVTEQINMLKQLEYEKQLSLAARNRANAYRDAAAARFKAEAETAAATATAEQNQVNITRLRLNYFHQLAGEYAAVNSTAVAMVTTAAQIANEEQRQANLAEIKKNLFHLLAGETASVSTYLRSSAVSAQQIADANLVGPISAAANTATTLAAQLGYSYDIVKKMMANGYEAPGPVIFNPMDPHYDPARAAAAGGLRDVYKPTSTKTAAGGGAGADKTKNELEQLQNSLMSQEQLEIESYQRRQQTLKDALAQKLLTQQEYTGLIEQSEAQHQFNMLKETNAGVSSTLNSLGQLFQGSKQVSAGIALANSYLAFTEVLKDPSYIGRPFARFAAAAAALSSGLSAVRSIKSAQPGGAGGGSISAGSAGGGGGAGAGGAQTSTQVSLQLVGGDLYSRDQVLQLINAINSATADGAQILLR